MSRSPTRIAPPRATLPAGGDRPEHGAGGRARRGPGRLEFGFTILALFILARSTVLFVRLRLGEEGFGGPLTGFWQDDPALRTVFFSVGGIAALLVACFGSPKRLICQFPLWILVAFVGLSVFWSVEPEVTQSRAIGFVGATAVGVYLGDRFRVGQQVFIVWGTAIVGAAASLFGLLMWPDLATSTNGVSDLWSGVYVNRNLLGVVLCLGLLGLPVVLRGGKERTRVALLVIAAVETYLLWRTRTRTGPVALMAAAAVASLVAVIRPLCRRGVSLAGGAAVTALSVGAFSYLLHRNWTSVVGWLGRDTTLTRRTEMWAIDRHFLEQRPFQGWGFEAIWTHGPTIEEARRAFKAAPLQAHNGYLEILLGVGYTGFGLLLVFLLFTGWRVFRLAWQSTRLEDLWPLALATFVVVLNFSESFFIANEALWSLLVAAGVAATPGNRLTPAKRTDPGAAVGGPRGSPPL